MPFRRWDVSATGRVGDGGCRCFIRKKVFLKYFNDCDYKGCLFAKCFVVVLNASVVSLPPEVRKSLVRR